MHGGDDVDLIDDLANRSDPIRTGEGEHGTWWRTWGQGKPVVLLHGDFGSWRHFVRNIDTLARQYRLLVPDMPGYGDSARPHEPYGPTEIAHPLAAGIVEILGPSAPFDLVGFSYGGIIATHLAALQPDRVKRLVLSGPGGFGIRSPSKDQIELRSLRSGMSPAEADQVHRHNLNRLMIADPAKVDSLAVRVHKENVGLARVQSGAIPDSDSLLQALAGVSARLFGIWGEDDAFGDPEHLERQRQLLLRFDPMTDFRVIPGAGHWLFYEVPEIVNELLVQMLES